MKTISFGNHKIEICVNNICGNVHNVIGLQPVVGYWVNLTVENNNNFKESFPLVDEHMQLQIFDEYDQALERVADLLLRNTSFEVKSTALSV